MSIKFIPDVKLSSFDNSKGVSRLAKGQDHGRNIVQERYVK